MGAPLSGSPSHGGKVARAIRRFCLDCQGDSPPHVTGCKDTACPLFSLRDSTLRPLLPEERPLRSIRRYCLSCAETRDDVRKCDAREQCGLWSFRFGVLPQTFKRVVSRRKRGKELFLLPANNSGA